MVLSLSFGSAGPLTVERLWFERAAKRGDMLFVARCAAARAAGTQLHLLRAIRSRGQQRKAAQPLTMRAATSPTCGATRQPGLTLGPPQPTNPLHCPRSSGNNGSDWSSYFGPPGSAQWRSYPASYDTPAMLSVANANCAGGVADTSQRNAGVDVAAPGTSVLSSEPGLLIEG